MKISTKLQMALQARSRSEQEVRALRQDMNQMKEKMDHIYQMMVLAQGVQHIESPSQHGSNSRQVI
jgi:5-bromo-4-chloroindolyl phosphate hydrolysis protein